MQIRAKQAENLFAIAYGFGDEHRVAFRRRLEHLRTYGCPTGLDTGRGRPAIYGWQQLLQQTLALDLVNVGYTPERAASFSINDTCGVHYMAAVLALSSNAIDAAKWSSSDCWPVDSSVFLIATPHELSRANGNDTKLDRRFEIVSGKDIVDRLTSRNPTETIGVIVDFGLTIGTLLTRVWAVTKIPVEEIASDFYAWADEYVHP